MWYLPFWQVRGSLNGTPFSPCTSKQTKLAEAKLAEAKLAGAEANLAEKAEV
jgi:hypothetical protein